jgi:hypothetical protein
VAMPAASAAAHANAFIVLIYVVCVYRVYRKYCRCPFACQHFLKLFLNFFSPPRSQAVWGRIWPVLVPLTGPAQAETAKKQGF